MEIIEKILNSIFSKKKNTKLIENKSFEYFLNKSSLKEHNGVHYFLDYKDEDVKNLLYALKYEKSSKSVDIIVGLLKNFIDKKELVIVPIPESNSRKLNYGFFHLRLIGKQLERELENVKYEEKLFFKRSVKQQAKQKDFNSRFENIRNSMDAREITKDKLYIVFDDITTSGATMVEAKRLFKNCNTIYLTVAH